METQSALIAQGHPRGHVGAAFFLKAVTGGIPQSQANALVPVRGSGVDGPDFTGGGAGLFIARAVVADEADDLSPSTATWTWGSQYSMASRQ